MTKKSIARLARDAKVARAKEELKNNQCWDDLHNSYVGCVTLLQQHVGIAQLARETEVIKFLENPSLVTQNIRSLGQDLLALNKELQEIHAQHEGKTGGSQDPDEVIRSIQIFEQYNLFMERHQAVVVPTALHILEQFNQAELRLAAFKANDAGEKARNPNDTSVIDVEVKTPQTAEPLSETEQPSA